MKSLFTLLAIFLISISSFAQQGINYKALIKDANGNVLNTFMNVQFTIHATSPTGSIVYQEDQTYTTVNGLLILSIGTSTNPIVGVFANIDWAADTHFLNITITYSAGTIDMGTTQFMSVPYAKHANTAAQANTSLDNKWTIGDTTNDITNSNTGKVMVNNDLEIGGTLNLQATAAIDEFSIDGTLAGNSDTAVPTEKAVKTYIDNATVSSNSIDGLNDAKSDSDGTNNGSSLFLGIDAGANDDGTDNKNVGVGYQALTANTMGSNNTANGFEALYSNTIGANNNAIGSEALRANETGNFNNAFGQRALINNTTGSNNTAIGNSALFSNTGNDNIGIGRSSLIGNTDGDKNIAIGNFTMNANSNASRNIAIGYSALQDNTTGSGNIAIGSDAIEENTTGQRNTGLGGSVLGDNETGNDNTAVGYRALRRNKTGDGNVANGFESLFENQSGNNNVAIGYHALNKNRSSSNTATGSFSLFTNSTGSGNVAIGNRAGYFETGSDKLYIANSDTSTPLIYGDFDTDLVRINGALEVTEEINRAPTGNANLVPIAYGTIESNANVLSGTGNFTATINAGVISISVNNEIMSVNNTSCLITPYSTAFRTSSIVINGGDIEVRTFNSSGNSAPVTFQFVIYKL